MSDPKWLELAQQQIGTKEIPGPRSNPTVEQYYRDAVNIHAHDDVPWCAAFVGSMLRRAGVKPSGTLMARSYLAWGRILAGPIQGAVVVFARGRPPSGHVAFVERVGGEVFTVVGGNQSDAVTRVTHRIGEGRILGYRWPSDVPLPTAPTAPKALHKGETKMADMTPQQILDTLSKLYGKIDSMGFSEVRPAVKKAIECMFYLTKLHLPPEAKALRRKPAKKPKKKSRR